MDEIIKELKENYILNNECEPTNCEIDELIDQAIEERIYKAIYGIHWKYFLEMIKRLNSYLTGYKIGLINKDIMDTTLRIESIRISHLDNFSQIEKNTMYEILGYYINETDI